MFKSLWKMGCVNSHPIKHPKKPLPTIPQHQASIISQHQNGQPSPPVPSQYQNGDRSDSIVSANSMPNFAPPPPIDNYNNIPNGYAPNQQQQSPTTPAPPPLADQQQTPTKSTKKKGFLGTWGKKPKFARSTSQASSTYSTHSEVNPAIQQQQQALVQRQHNVPLPTPPPANANIPPNRNNPQSQTKIVIALYAYEGRDEGELSFDKNEKLVIVDDTEPDWWLAYKLTAPEKRGYIPMNFVVNNVIETEEWFFSKISRRVAERLLLDGDYPRGTFLIRNSEQDSAGNILGAYSLSIRDFDSLKLDHVKHYKIQTKPNGDFFITSRRSFVKLQDLIEHYSTSANGLCHRLTKPCPKTARNTVGPRVGDEIDRRDLKFVRELGSGNFGKVFFGIFRGQTKVAIKTLKPGSMTPSAFMQEAAIMRRYRHDKLVPLYGVCSQGMPLLIITEFMSKGALLNYLRDNPESAGLTIIDMIDMASQVASGMAYLEQVKLVHRDLAARNCLVGDNRVVKVADFGLARIIEEDYYIAQVGAKFPIKWTAPEAASRGKFTSKSDVWSYGILLYEIVTRGQVPYPGMSNRDVLEQVDRGYRMPKPKSVECPNSLYQVMLQCWDKDPEKRPTFEYLYSYFDDFFVATEPRYRDAEDFHAGTPMITENHYDKMVK